MPIKTEHVIKDFPYCNLYLVEWEFSLLSKKRILCFALAFINAKHTCKHNSLQPVRAHTLTHARMHARTHAHTHARTHAHLSPEGMELQNSLSNLKIITPFLRSHNHNWSEQLQEIFIFTGTFRLSLTTSHTFLMKALTWKPRWD